MLSSSFLREFDVMCELNCGKGFLAPHLDNVILYDIDIIYRLIFIFSSIQNK